MHAILTRPDGTTIHTRLDVRPTRYSHSALGGPDAAELAVSGDNNALSDVLTWLACHVVIYNESALPVWWGLVQAATVTLDGVQYGLDASQIVNRMAVVYADELGNPASTTWVEDAHSIALYGRRELRMSVKAETNAPALAQATRIVNERSAPLRSVSGGNGEPGARLACVGYWRTLDWRFWSQSVGQVERDQDVNATEMLGWSITSAGIGFHLGHMCIGATGAVLYPLAETDRIIVTGSGSNDDTYEVSGPDDRTAVTAYNSVEISFDASDDVHDQDGVLNMFRPGDLVEITDSTSNDGIYFVKDMFQNGDGSFDHMRTYPNTIIDELAGANLTITAGNSIVVAPRPAAYEMPSATITLKSQATKIAMTVTLTLSAGELSEIWIQAAKIGAPGDNLKIELCANDGGSGLPGTVLNSATVSGASLPLLESLDWVQWTFDHAVPAVHGAYYVVISRTGSADDDAYRIGLREADGDFDSADAMLLYDGSNWIARTVESGLDAALALRIYAQRVTTDQVADIVSGVGDWLAGTRIGTASGLRTRRYRGVEQAQTALSEIKDLLEFGTAGGSRLLARVSADRVVMIDAAPASDQPGYIWTADGLRDRWGVQLAPGLLPVGEWVAFDVAGASGVFAPAFLEAAEFDVAAGTVRPSFRSGQAVQTLARLAQDAALPALAVRMRPYLLK